VEGLSRAAGISTRRLARLFSIEVGLTPKLYARVQRFSRVVESIYNSSAVDWSDLAVRCGYFDQAHFIRDFKAFSGLTPGDYRSRGTVSPHHVRL
jgi:AraC-like DNA-binding protein